MKSAVVDTPAESSGEIGSARLGDTVSATHRGGVERARLGDMVSAANREMLEVLGWNTRFRRRIGWCRRHSIRSHTFGDASGDVGSTRLGAIVSATHRVESEALD